VGWRSASFPRCLGWHWAGFDLECIMYHVACLVCRQAPYGLWNTTGRKPLASVWRWAQCPAANAKRAEPAANGLCFICTNGLCFICIAPTGTCSLQDQQGLLASYWPGCPAEVRVPFSAPRTSHFALRSLAGALSRRAHFSFPRSSFKSSDGTILG
jgi:hypothetical protein